MATLNSHGFEPTEQAIMDAWDAGLMPEQIASRLGLPLSRVRKTLGIYIAASPEDRWQYRATVATGALLAALARVHPERMAA